jgi:hypothetical protein
MTDKTPEQQAEGEAKRVRRENGLSEIESACFEDGFLAGYRAALRDAAEAMQAHEMPDAEAIIRALDAREGDER